MDINPIISLHQRGDVDGAEAGCRAILTQNPRHAAALQMLSLLLKQQNRLAETAEIIVKIVEIQPDIANNWTNLGAVRRALGDYAGALRSFRIALSLSPAHETTAFNLANLLGGADSDESRAVLAERWFERVLVCTPDHQLAQNNLSMLRQKFAAALEAAARREVVINPASTQALRRLAHLALQRSGILEWRPGKVGVLHLVLVAQALRLLQHSEQISPDAETGRLWRAVALDLFQLAGMDERMLATVAEASLKRLRVAPKDQLAGALVGYHLYRNGRAALVSRLQTRFLARFSAAEIAENGELGYWSMLRADAVFFKRLPPVETILERLPKLEFPINYLSEGDGPVIYASGDDAYIRRFGPDLLRSIAKHSPGADVVLNLTSPTPPTLGLAEQWRRELPLSFAVSFDRTNVRQWPLAKRNVYFACIRFIRALQWRRRLNRPLILIDLDAEARCDLRSTAEGMENYDLAMMLDKRLRGPFRETPVGFVYYNNTPDADAFLATVAAYIGHFLLDAEPCWMLDQTAHYATLRHYAATKTPLRVRWHDFQSFPFAAFVGEK